MLQKLQQHQVAFEEQLHRHFIQPMVRSNFQRDIAIQFEPSNDPQPFYDWYGESEGGVSETDRIQSVKINWQKEGF